MNRQILFRGLTPDGKWVVGGTNSPLHSPGEKSYIISTSFYEGKEEKEKFEFIEVIPQSLGLMSTVKTDYNEVYLFHGDIVKVQIYKPQNGNYHGNNPEWKIFKAQIVFDGDRFFFLNLQKGMGWQAWHSKNINSTEVGSLEIIGNVTQHPELLKS